MAHGDGRLLPTLHWDKSWAESKPAMVMAMSQRILGEFLEVHGSESENDLPPVDVVLPIAAMNVGKRMIMKQEAERSIKAGLLREPPTSYIPSFMGSGNFIPGLEDGYLNDDYPSLELFAYNRLGKKSWLNSRFAAHCLRAVGLAYPDGQVHASEPALRTKAHSASRLTGQKTTDSEDWLIISSKSPIATVSKNGRDAMLVSRVTGAVDLSNPHLTNEESDSILELSMHEKIPDCDIERSLAQKALLADAIIRNDGSGESPFHPVIQTVYLTQLKK